jgi:NAD(P)-dependent dehydrogenase (short-subunit alcohol dehydrogenase family)
MTRVFITGSADGLGSLTARALVKEGHKVVLHARSATRAKEAAEACPGAETVLVGDLSSFSETKKLAEEVNKLGKFDAIIHNAALYRGGFNKPPDGLPTLVSLPSLESSIGN